ncbi:MAG: FAD-dependent oxidoreductase, partial [Pseudomonadota bacterium]
TRAAAGMLSPAFEIFHEKPDLAHRQVLHDALGLWDTNATLLADDPYRSFGYRRDGVYGIGFSCDLANSKPVAADDRFGFFTEAPGVCVQGEGVVEPDALRGLLYALAKKAGVRIVNGQARRGDGPTLTIDGETMGAHTLIVTAGVASDPEVTPVRGRALLMRLDPEDRAAVPTVVRSPRVYFCPRRDNLVYIGATEEWPEDDARGSLDALMAEALRLLPCLKRAQLVSKFDGLRPFVGRSGPRIDWADERVLVAFGHHRNGVLLAPWTAQRISDLLGL